VRLGLYQLAMARLTDEDWDAKRYEAGQLFSPAAPIDERDLFAGRGTQIRKMLEAVNERGKHAVLFGERGVGKTSLAKVFSAMFPRTFRSILAVREQVDPSDDFSSIWRKVFKDLHVRMANADADAQYTPLAKEYPGVIQPDDVRREFQEIFGTNDIPIIVIDEFDKSRESQDGKIHELMANTIKHLSDYSVNATIILVGVADDINDLIGEHPSITRCLEQIPMPRMQQDEIRQILDSRVGRLGMKMHGDAYFKVVELSRGLPSYAHLLGLYATQSAIERRSLAIVETDVDAAIARALEKSQESTQADYNHAVHSNRSDGLHRQVLLACALAKPDERGLFSPNSVCAPLSDILRRPVTIANFQQHLQMFITEERGSVLVRKGRERAYKFRFRDPMMQPYVIMKGIDEGLIPKSSLSVLSAPVEPELPIDFSQPH
jgi:energy-coupling factor transporter ATP-binding protein EcfA2